MIAFIDEHRGAYGVEPICKALPIAPSTYHEHAAQRADPSRLPYRAKRDAELRREGAQVARCTVARLMRDTGLAGVIRGKPVRTTVGDKAAPCPLDRQVRAPAPNRLWVSDFTYGSTWSGFVNVAFVIDAFARRIVGWRMSRSAQAGFVLDALEQALHERRPTHSPLGQRGSLCFDNVFRAPGGGWHRAVRGQRRRQP